ncbi:TPA: hypothetical protein DIC40_02030 [Patescibacteria group bacterium]|nr:hypothetical protein P148_SR1C00001G0272 [candidate division SR1 bacterium RAAC1_SR1_1]HCY20633.1 hypothetical protein [Candidatus Gracilibacteria bacterium]
METKKVTLKLKDELFVVTICGDKNHINQITKKQKKIRFFCKNAELRVLTSYLIKDLREILETKTFMVENTIFGIDNIGNTFLILKGEDYYVLLNNNELRIPVVIPRQTIQTWEETTKTCNALPYKPMEQNFTLRLI